MGYTIPLPPTAVKLWKWQYWRYEDGECLFTHSCLSIYMYLHLMTSSDFTWTASSETVPSSIRRMRIYRSSCACTYYHSDICSPFIYFIIFNDSVSGHVGPDQTMRMRRLICAFTVRICPKIRFRMGQPFDSGRLMSTIMLPLSDFPSMRIWMLYEQGLIKFVLEALPNWS